MPTFITLLSCIALCTFARGSLDLGPAHVDVDVFMTLDHGASSMTTGTTNAEPIPSPTTQYSEVTQPALSPYSEATSYIGSAWRDLTDGLHDSEPTDATQSQTLEPTLASTTHYIESTHPTLHPYSKVTSYIGSAWRDINAELQGTASLSSLSTVAPFVTLAASVDSFAISALASSSGNEQMPSEASSGIMGTGVSTTQSEPLHIEPTAVASSCNSSRSDSLRANTTTTWAWPPVSSAAPSLGNPHPSNATSSSLPIVAQSKVDGSPVPGAGAWFLAMVFLLAAELCGRG